MLAAFLRGVRSSLGGLVGIGTAAIRRGATPTTLGSLRADVAQRPRIPTTSTVERAAASSPSQIRFESADLAR